MGELRVRDIEDELIDALRRRAARHGRSPEAEHREILRAILGVEASRPSIKDFLQQTMPESAGDETDIDEQPGAVDLPRRG